MKLLPIQASLPDVSLELRAVAASRSRSHGNSRDPFKIAAGAYRVRANSGRRAQQAWI
jgi:hypothetical protein